MSECVSTTINELMSASASDLGLALAVAPGPYYNIRHMARFNIGHTRARTHKQFMQEMMMIDRRT